MEYAVVSEQRWREEMEDTHIVVENFRKPGWIFGGVYDGHTGSRVADQLRQHTHLVLSATLQQGGTTEKCFLRTYACLANQPWALEMLRGGACTANFLIQRNSIVCANVGDCRIVVSGTRVEQITVDHDVLNTTERHRIEKCGAKVGGTNNRYVEYGDYFLMPTRVIGDSYFRPAGVISRPTVRRHVIGKDDRFLIAGSDGLFYKTSNDVVHEHALHSDTAEELAAKLKNEVESLNGSDNLTIIVVKL